MFKWLVALVAACLSATYVLQSDAAPDANGYEALYECRAGNPNCNVDVEALAGPSRPCDQVIAPSTPWSNINWSNDVICIQAGNHTGKGRLTVQGSGSSGNYKVLRYFRSGDTNDDPWRQSSTDQARIQQLFVNGNFWIIHRLTIPQGNVSGGPKVESSGGTDNHIFSRMLVEGTGTSSTTARYGYSQNCPSGNSDNVTWQNSVFRNSGGQNSQEGIALDMQCGSNLRAVNNEIYDWCSHGIQTGNNGHPTLTGLIIENNDMYVSPVMHTDGGTRAKTEGPLDTKAHGTSSSPVRVFHNRFWGARRSNTSFCGNGGGGGAITLNSDSDWQWYYNNIMIDSTAAIRSTNTPVSDRDSYIGNIAYQIRGYGQITAYAFHLGSNSTTEVYFNTVIDAENSLYSGGNGANNDVRANVWIDSGGQDDTRSGLVIDHNVFYNTPVFTFGGSSTNLSRNIVVRGNSQSYSAGQIMRRTSNLSLCTAEDDPDCFLYLATTSGTTGGSSPSFATTLGGTFQDGSITWLAIRGPYAFFRKLKTGPEQFVIPYVRLAPNAPEAKWVEKPGTRTGIGIDNTLPW